ncbi:hypothetical protein DEH69_26325 [Streptomyces sp. PT12]|nr:hypothetical protein DEH69_26325 [Streptomyces sp. PT12]
MCGMVGYVGAQARSALEVVLAGLGRLERPGHDSSGVAVLAEDGGIAVARAAGGLAALDGVLRERPLPTGGSAVGHLRRATHGAPSEGNAHPQLDNAGRVAVVHDGEIANHAALRAELAARGHALASETDTEVVAHLLAEQFSSCEDLGEAMRQVCRSLVGEFALLAVHADEPDTVVGARRGQPLVVGLGDGESFAASDGVAFGGLARDVVGLADDHVVVLRRDVDGVGCEITDAGGSVVTA